MKATRRSEAKAHAVIEKPPLAMVAHGNGHASTAAPHGEPSRQARIREAAYARYESRGRTDGHDLDDWLAAEAELSD